MSPSKRLLFNPLCDQMVYIMAINRIYKAMPTVAIRGIVAETYDLPENDICTITYKVSEDAVSGDVINLVLQVPTYQLGVDKSGNEVYDVEKQVETKNLVLTVE